MSNEPEMTHLIGAREHNRALRDDVQAGLAQQPKRLPPRWLYDEQGCELFDAITELDEYYPTRREHEILTTHATDIADLCRVDTLVELGSGASPKTRLLLDALSRDDALQSFVALDVAESALDASLSSIAVDYPALELAGIVGDFEQHLDHIASSECKLVAFLGGTIGNLEPEPRNQFLTELAGSMNSGDFLLVGTDLVKDRARLVAAYDDALGVTAAFNLNVLSFLNYKLGANFDPATFDHVALFDEANSWIEMQLRSRIEQTVALPAMEMLVHFDAGEHVRTEVSTKFEPEAVVAELDAHQLGCVAQWTDDAGDFAVTLAQRA